MLVVLDTNVLFQSLYSSEGASHFILSLVRHQRIKLALSLKVESDNIFVELAVASGSKFVITNNVRDFTHNSQLRFPDFSVVTPSDFVKRWRKENEK